MNWNLESRYVVGLYLGEFEVVGLVLKSRRFLEVLTNAVCYEHTVRLVEPFPENAYGIQPSDTLDLTDNEVIRVFSEYYPAKA